MVRLGIQLQVMSNFTFYGERKEADYKIFFLFLNLDLVLSNSTQGRFTYI